MSSLGRRDFALLAASVAPFVYTLFDSSQGDVPLYHRYAQNLLGGALPYRDWVFEYPPYALMWLVLPGAAHGATAFRALFSLQVLALDLVVKVVLLHEGRRRPQSTELGRLGPFLVFSVLGIFQSYFYLKRLDAIAAALVVVALVSFANDRLAAAGALLSVAAGTKLYPALIAPALLCLAFERGKALRLVAGAAAALVPLAVISIFVPWWRFASFQAARGLQVESSYGAILWLMHFFGTPASWVSRPGCCLEVGGPAALALTPVARVLFGAVTLAAVGASVVCVWPRSPGLAAGSGKSAESAGSARLGRVALLPIVAFMVSSVALSPQFAVWLIGPLALAAARGRPTPLAVLAVAVLLTALVFPAPGYFTPGGIALGRTLVLVARNATLLIALALLVGEVAATRSGARTMSPPDDTVL